MGGSSKRAGSSSSCRYDEGIGQRGLHPLSDGSPQMASFPFDTIILIRSARQHLDTPPASLAPGAFSCPRDSRGCCLDMRIRARSPETDSYGAFPGLRRGTLSHRFPSLLVGIRARADADAPQAYFTIIPYGNVVCRSGTCRSSRRSSACVGAWSAMASLADGDRCRVEADGRRADRRRNKMRRTGQVPPPPEKTLPAPPVRIRRFP